MTQKVERKDVFQIRGTYGIGLRDVARERESKAGAGLNLFFPKHCLHETAPLWADSMIFLTCQVRKIQLRHSNLGFLARDSFCNLDLKDRGSVQDGFVA
jgi:hypothetical protein